VGIVEVILLDTHVWIWLCHDDLLLPAGLRNLIELQRNEGIGVSAISVWEVAKLVERGRLELPMEMDAWMQMALGGSAVALLPLSPSIAVESTKLPGEFHRDPADQIIVATARVHDLSLATCDQRIRAYPHVRLSSEMQIHDR